MGEQLSGEIIDIKRDGYRWLLTIQPDGQQDLVALHLHVNPDRRAPQVGDRVDIELPSG